jgi:hypothetical protein
VRLQRLGAQTRKSLPARLGIVKIELFEDSVFVGKGDAGSL